MPAKKATAERRNIAFSSAWFIGTYNELLNQGHIKNGMDFCEKAGISSSMLTEIRKGRSGPGENTIMSMLRAFPMINEYFLRGGMHPILKEPKKSQSIARQILELKELVEEGIITEREFEMGKRKILK